MQVQEAGNGFVFLTAKVTKVKIKAAKVFKPHRHRENIVY
jgi:hypothetical protein